MANGIKIANELGLTNVQFVKEDVRNISKARIGEFDVVFFLGLLYHLDTPDIFLVLEKVYDICRNFVIIDTHVALDGTLKRTHGNADYFGAQYKEHEASDSPEVKADRVKASIDNPYSFWLTKESLYRLLFNTGFTTVLECHVPFRPDRIFFNLNDRIDLVAIRGRREKLSSYPWINKLSEEEIAEMLRDK